MTEEQREPQNKRMGQKKKTGRPKGKCNTSPGIIQEILKEKICGNVTNRALAERFSLTEGTIGTIVKRNQDLYDQIVKELRQKISLRSLDKAEKCIKRIRTDKINASSGLQLSQMSNNLLDNAREKDNTMVSVNINLPESAEELAKLVFDVESPMLSPADSETFHDK